MSPSIEKMIMVLKEEFRARGLRRTDVAARLGISEVTVKRYLSGKSLTIPTLERLAALVDQDLLSLAASAQEQTIRLPEFSQVQQAALSKSKPLMIIFILLLRNWPQARIENYLGLSRQELGEAIAKLEQFGLIRRLPGNRIKPLVRFHINPKGDNPLSEYWREHARKFIMDFNLRGNNSEWDYNGYWLSPASVRELRGMMQRFMADVRALGRKDVALSSDELSWYRIFIGTEAGATDNPLADRRN